MKKRLISSVLFLGCIFPSVVLASTDSRLMNLEKLTQAQSELIYQMQQDLSAAFRDIADLRGQLEYTTHQLNQTIERQKTILLEMNQQASSGEVSSSAVAGSSDWSASGDDEQDYNQLLDLAINQKQYAKATTGFQAFIKQYPNSNYVGNATYWAGQLLYNQKKWDEASFYFASVVKNYPRSDKAAESMYKVGRILEAKGDQERAQAVYIEVVRKYPNASIIKDVKERLKLQ